MSDADHWSEVYRRDNVADASWHQEVPATSLMILDRFGLNRNSSLLDVGGGDSNLVDFLLERGWDDLTVLDFAPEALAATRRRLDSAADAVEFVCADLARWTPHRTFDVWHDRAVLHFMNDVEQRRAYLKVLDRGLAADGLAIIATFAPGGPEKCSGLPVRRYDASSLACELGEAFQLVDDCKEDHRTPTGVFQEFTWCAFRRA